MKIDRLIGILSVLLQNEKITAPELAERFEVSRRTIIRDIEDLCKAGIPIYATQGNGGGIKIMDGYKMDKTLLSSKDMQMIMAGLRSLDSVSGSGYYGQLMEKIQTGSTSLVNGNASILIDLSTWYKDSLTPKISLIQDGIELKKTIRFRYYASSGDSDREIEPYYLIFKWANWYVYGWCTLRQDFRTFKVNRMDKISHVKSFEERKEVPMPDLSIEKIFPGEVKVKAIFEPSMKWHLIEDFGIDSFTQQEDGTLLFEGEYTDVDGLVAWLLGCRDQVTVLEPTIVREKLHRITSNISKKYEGKE